MSAANSYSEPGGELSPLEPLEEASDAARHFHSAALTGISTWNLKTVERSELLALMGQRGITERLLASNKRLRLQSTAILAQLFSRLRRLSVGRPDRRFWNVSFLGPLVNEYRPQLDVDAYRQAIDRLLRAESLSALFSMELQPLTNYPQKGHGRSFLVNAHALAWSDDRAFDADDAQKRLSARAAIFSEFGAGSVWLTERSTSEGEIEYLAHYLTKAPATGKYRRKDPENSSRWILSPVANVRPDLQLRLLEVLSHLEFTDLVWGVNKGTRIRGEWKSRLVAWNKARCDRSHAPLESDFDTGELWKRLRSRNGTLRYHPPEFYGPRPRPISSEKLPRHGGKRLWPSQAARFEEGKVSVIGEEFWARRGSLKHM